MNEVPVNRRLDAWPAGAAHLALATLMSPFLLLPLALVVQKCFVDADGRFVGAHNFVDYLEDGGVLRSMLHSLTVGALVTMIVVPMAFMFTFAYAYALTRSYMPLKNTARPIELLPLLAPTLLSATLFIYRFGNAGLLKPLLHGHSIYGLPGIVLSRVSASFPHVLMILVTALSLADGRLYEAADAIGTRRLRHSKRLIGIRRYPQK